MNTFKRLESNVRGYCRSFPAVFNRAKGSSIYDSSGREYLDFLAGAGSLNYGHNNSAIMQQMVEYIEKEGIVHGLDFHTEAKQRFLESLDKRVLWPLEMDYKVQFTGPTGTNAVEASFKLARMITGRTNIISFTRGFHGVSLGSVAATASSHFRDAAGVPLDNVTFMPYCGYMGDDLDSLEFLRRSLADSNSGLDLPAAVIVETIQGEGGVNTASSEWLQGLQALCEEYEILLILDDIQVGCGRTGPFFSFEDAGITPDIITLSKSLSGSGLPMAVVLMKQELDQWEPGQHNGTFRGNNLAFVTATAALERYWSDTTFTSKVQAKGRGMHDRCEEIVENHSGLGLEVRGRGMIQAIACPDHPALAGAVSAAAFKAGLIVETCGEDDHVLKLLPPLTTSESELDRGLDVIAESFDTAVSDGSALSESSTQEAQR